MTTHTKRRGRRSFAAIPAAMFVASVLAVVAGSPAQAANTAGEVRVDHDGNAATAMAREFAGQDRYDTAFRLAKNFAAEKGGLGAVPAAFVASGDTLVDTDSSWCGTEAVSAVLINGSSDALAFGVAVQATAYRLQLPLLMTAAGELPDATAEFISENDVEHVQIVGGAEGHRQASGVDHRHCVAEGRLVAGRGRVHGDDHRSGRAGP